MVVLGIQGSHWSVFCKPVFFKKKNHGMVLQQFQQKRQSMQLSNEIYKSDFFLKKKKNGVQKANQVGALGILYEVCLTRIRFFFLLLLLQVIKWT